MMNFQKKSLKMDELTRKWLNTYWYKYNLLCVYKYIPRHVTKKIIKNNIWLKKKSIPIYEKARIRNEKGTILD